MVKPDCGDETFAVLGEAQGGGREALLEQVRRSFSGGRKSRKRAAAAVHARTATMHGRNTVENDVAVLVTGLRAEARRYQVVGGCCLEGTDVPTADSAIQKPAISPELGISVSSSIGHAALSGAISMVDSSHCSDLASIRKLSYLVSMNWLPSPPGSPLRFRIANAVTGSADYLSNSSNMFSYLERNRAHSIWRVPADSNALQVVVTPSAGPPHRVARPTHGDAPAPVAHHRADDRPSHSPWFTSSSRLSSCHSSSFRSPPLTDLDRAAQCLADLEPENLGGIQKPRTWRRCGA